MRLSTRSRAADALRDSLRGSTAGAKVAGVLVSAPGSALADKVVGPDGAELFARLQQPAAANLAPALVTELVLDGVLEIRTCGERFERLPQSHAVPPPSTV